MCLWILFCREHCGNSVLDPGQTLKDNWRLLYPMFVPLHTSNITWQLNFSGLSNGTSFIIKQWNQDNHSKKDVWSIWILLGFCRGSSWLIFVTKVENFYLYFLEIKRKTAELWVEYMPAMPALKRLRQGESFVSSQESRAGVKSWRWLLFTQPAQGLFWRKSFMFHNLYYICLLFQLRWDLM